MCMAKVFITFICIIDCAAVYEHSACCLFSVVMHIKEGGLKIEY